MLCPKCEGATNIQQSAIPGPTAKKRGVEQLVEKGRKVFSWWSDEFRIRRRRCSECGEKFSTIEITTKDLADAFSEIARDHLGVGSPWCG